MDPKTCFVLLLDAMASEDYIEADRAGAALLEWLRNGVAVPDLDGLSEAHRRIIVKATCWSAISFRTIVER